MRTSALFVCLVLSMLGAEPAIAQAPPPVVQVAPASPPARFVLVTGAVIIGTLVAQDAELFTISTATGTVQVRRVDVASMDYQTAPPPTVVVAAAPPPAPFLPPPRPRRRGRGLTIAGAIVFGLSYGLSASIGASVGRESPSAYWFLVPVAGPMIWAGATDCGHDVDEQACRAVTYTFGTFLTLIQAAGATMLIAGLSLRASSADQAGEPRHLARAGTLELVPVVTPSFGGLALVGDL
ncbi:MAG: hypothetical protein HYY06_13210 [Deltaproteobacteria bacterium]|nr:hypothetical protein [Deltaproteobacteria bacterium]